MPSRTPVSEETERRILEAHAELQNGRAVARKLGLHPATVQVVLRRHRGTCVRCNREVAAGHKHCADCLAFLREEQKARRKARRRASLCEMCDQPIARTSRKFCTEHRLRDLEYHADRYHEQKNKRGTPYQGIPDQQDRERSIRGRHGKDAVLVWRALEGRCILCGIGHSERAVCIHHIDGNPKNPAINNLTCLCSTCHKLVHLLIEHPNLDRAIEWIGNTYPDIKEALRRYADTLSP